MAETNSIDKIIDDLGVNYKNDEEVLNEILEEVSSIASDISNRQKDDEKLFPYIKKNCKSNLSFKRCGRLNKSWRRFYIKFI